MTSGDFSTLLLLTGCLALSLPLLLIPEATFRRLPQLRALSSLWVVLGIALTVRILAVFLLRDTNIWDLDSYRIVARAWRNGQDVYLTASDRHPYFPLQIYAIVASDFLSRHFHLPFQLLVRVPVLVADIAIAGLIWVALRPVSLESALSKSLAYALSPLPIMVLAYGAQFDAIPVALVLAAALLRFRAKSFRIGIVASAVLMGLAITDKTWPLILLPVLSLYRLNARDFVFYTLLAVAIPLLTAGVYSIEWGTPMERLIRVPLEYRGVGGRWGLEGSVAMSRWRYPGIAATYASFAGVVSAFFLGGLLIVYLQGLSWDSAWRRLALVIMTFYVSMSGFGLQYLMWLIPFALLAEMRIGTALFGVIAAIGGIVVYHIEVFPDLRGDISAFLGTDGIDRTYQAALLPVWLTSLAIWVSWLLPGEKAEEGMGAITRARYRPDTGA